MARKRTPKAKTEATAEAQMTGLDFAPMMVTEEAEPEVKKEATDVAALQAQIASLNARLDARENEMMVHLSTPVIPEVKVEAPKPLDFSSLPDPVTDPGAYGLALAQQIQANIDVRNANENAQRQNNQNREQRLTNLWDDFSNAYPEIAEDKENIELIAHKVATAAKKRGVDLDRYMFGTPQKFMDDMAKTYEKVFGEEDEPATPRRRVAAQEEEPVRTSVFGGIESGGRPSAANDPKAKGDMLSDMRAMQTKSGFF